MKNRNSPVFAIILNLLLPGLGHIYWSEYLFGVFVFLIMLIAIILFFVSFFLSLSLWPKAILLILPLLFYLFTFVDLVRAIRSKAGPRWRGRRAVIIFLAMGIVYQSLSPIAPGNFFIRNRPETFVLEDTGLSPLYSPGEPLKASRLAYSVDVFFLKKPILHTLPQRYDIVRFADADGRRRNGLVIGLPDEEIQMVDGVLVVNGLADFGDPPGGIVLWGDCPLTYVDPYSILVATLSLNRVDEVFMVPLGDVIGKISKVF